MSGRGPVAPLSPLISDASTLPPLAASAEIESLVLADRAELWASIAPGLGHHLANALMTLSYPAKNGEMRPGIQRRIEETYHVLHAMAQTEIAPRVPLRQVLDDVVTWHRLQIALPRVPLVLESPDTLPGSSDGRLHHALIALVTGAKQEGAAAMTLAAQSEPGGVVLKLAKRGVPAVPANRSAVTTRRRRVILHLLQQLGADVDVREAGSDRFWSVRVPRTEARASRNGVPARN